MRIFTYRNNLIKIYGVRKVSYLQEVIQIFILYSHLVRFIGIFSCSLVYYAVNKTFAN